MPTVRVPLSGHGHVRLRIEEEGGAFLFLAVAAAAVIAFAHGGSTDHPNARAGPDSSITAGGAVGTVVPPDARATSDDGACQSLTKGLSTTIDQGVLRFDVVNDAARTRSFHVHVTFYAADTGRFLGDEALAVRAIGAHSRSASQRLPMPSAEAGLRCRFALSHF